MKAPALWYALARWEERWCTASNRWCQRGRARPFFALVSRLGDGLFWYALMAVVVLADGLEGLQASVHMAATGFAALLLYRGLKRWTRRARPCASSTQIRALVAPLDEFSFPSGHTLHASAFTLVALSHYPTLAVLLVPFTVLVAASRVVLGLHYPSDVLAALVIGNGIGVASMAVAGAL